MARLYMRRFNCRSLGFLLAANGDVVDQWTRPETHAEQIAPGQQNGQHAVAKSHRTKMIGNLPNNRGQEPAAYDARAEYSSEGAMMFLQRIKRECEDNRAADGTPKAEHRQSEHGRVGAGSEQGEQERQGAASGEDHQDFAG